MIINEQSAIKVRALSTTDLIGGAARAAYRLQTGLLAKGVDTEMWVQQRTGSSSKVRSRMGGLGQFIGQIYPYLDASPKIFYPARQKGAWTAGFLPNPLFPSGELRRADLVHCHWVSEGFLPLTQLGRIGRPIIWTLHDMSAFTGGCHYAGDCLAFTERCGACPQLGSCRERDLSRLGIWARERFWQTADISLVCPSRWLAKQAGRSPLFANRTITVIPNGLDLEVYKPIEKAKARSVLGLPQEKTLLLTAAMNVTGDRRKGFVHLEKTLHLLEKLVAKNHLEVLVLGGTGVSTEEINGIQIRHLGQFTEEDRMVFAYSSADVFIAPSEQDNLPNTVMEAMACGTPVVAFDVGGMPDLINHEQNGLLVEPFSIEMLAAAIERLCLDREECLMMGRSASTKVKNKYELSLIAGKYMQMYEDVLEKFKAGM